jgi:hypothetical protein
VAEDQEASEVQRVLVRQLGRHRDFPSTLNSASFQLLTALIYLLLQGCIVVGVLLMFASTIGGLRSIIQDASAFQFYS